MSVKIRGLSALQSRLENAVQRSSRGAREALKRGAHKVLERAQGQSPELYGNLADAIQLEKVRDDKRRVAFQVSVDGSHAAGSKDQKTVGEYVEPRHEGTYNLGARSLAKQSANGLVVGRGFLSRALDDLREEIEKDVAANALKGVGK